MHRPSHSSIFVALLLAAGCSNGESPTVEGESVVVAQRGTGFTEERRELDRELGLETVPAAPTEAQQAAVDPSSIDPSTLTVGGVDPSLAARLKADPSAYATKKIDGLVTFRMLSLTGIDLDALLDYLFLDVQGTQRRLDSTARDLAFELMRAAIGYDRAETGGGAARASAAAGYGPRDESGKAVRAHLTELGSLSKTLGRVMKFAFPAPIQALDQTEAAIVGYMIPLEYKPKSEDIKVFMLVRDLMACCFGGAPKPDEWTDVKMDGEGAGYWSYVPVITRGIFRLAGIADEAGYAAGAYSIEGHDVRREL